MLKHFWYRLDLAYRAAIRGNIREIHIYLDKAKEGAVELGCFDSIAPEFKAIDEAISLEGWGADDRATAPSGASSRLPR